MAPKAEILVPSGEISPSSMATFLKNSRPGLEFGQQPTYPQIFSKLRGLPPVEQEKLLVGFYSQKVEAFPNGAELGKFLVRINNISWFHPESPPDRESLERLCHQALSRLNLPDLPLRIIEKDWGAALGATLDAALDTAWGAALGAALGAARDAALDTALDKARDAAWGTALGTTLDAARGAARGAEWIVVKDLMPQRGYNKGNPFEPLMEIYELGCWPIGIVPDQSGKKEFVVFIPSIQKTT